MDAVGALLSLALISHSVGVSLSASIQLGQLSLGSMRGGYNWWQLSSTSPRHVSLLESTRSHLILGFTSDGSLWLLRLLQNNNITGQIPPGLGNLPKLQTLDLSSNKFFGLIPESLGLLNNLQYLRLNNNSLSGSIPFARLTKLTFLDLSFNNLSGPVAKFPATTYKSLCDSTCCSWKHKTSPV